MGIFCFNAMVSELQRRLREKLPLNFSPRENVFYLFLIASLLYQVAENWKDRDKVYIAIFFILYFIFSKGSRPLTLLLFLSYVILQKARVFPGLANHSNLFLFLCIFLLCDLLLRIFQRERKVDFWKALPYLLIITYFYAGFHKINSGFLYDTEHSCSRWYIEKLFRPFWSDFRLESPLIISFLSVSVLLTELGGALLLAFRRTRHLGLLSALSLHAILSPGGFVDFASVAIACMLTFLPKKLFEDKERIERIIKSYGLLTIFYALLTWLLIFFEIGEGRRMIRPVQGFIYIPTVGLVIYLLFAKRANKISFLEPEPSKERIGKLGWVVILFLVFWGAQNYLGLRTTGTFSMFSNLTTEGERSNHLLLGSNPLKIFSYQDDLVWIREVRPPYLDDFGKLDRISGSWVPLVAFQRALWHEQDPWRRKRWDPCRKKCREYEIDFSYKGEDYTVSHILSDERWTPREKTWEMKLLQFRKVHSAGEPVSYKW